METTDLIFEKNGKNITAAGYLIDSKLMQSDNPAAIVMGGGGIETFLESIKLGQLAVPLGLFYLQDLAKKSANSFNTSVFELYDEDNGDKTINLVDETLYDKLLSMVDADVKEATNKAKITRKKKDVRGIAKKTRKH